MGHEKLKGKKSILVWRAWIPFKSKYHSAVYKVQSVDWILTPFSSVRMSE